MCDTGFGFSDIYWAQDTFELNANEENNIFVKIPIDTKNVKLVFDGDSETIIDHLSIETSLGCNYTNENLSLSIDHTSGKISGQINAENKGILMIPICVNEGWEAWIDGQETDILKAYPFILPDEEILNSFNDIVVPVFEKIKNNSREINGLAQLRDALLPKLMSGEIDVSEVEV